MVIARDTERDYHLSGEEALTYGLVDRVVREREMPSRSNGSGRGDDGNGGGDGA